METIERLKDIVNAGANLLTKEDKTFVYETADNLSIGYKKSTCKSCVIDLAIICANAISDGKTDGSGLRLKAGVDIIVNGTRINNLTCSTAEDCEKAIKLGTPRHYFDFD